MTWRPWREAMHDALYGESPRGFYRRPGGPAAHFRTSVHASPLFAAALVGLAEQVDAMLGNPDGFDLVDVGAGRGELLARLAPAAPERWRLHGVDVVPRPPGLPERVAWYADLADLPVVRGLVVANEWLDNVPVDVVAAGRLVLVDEAGGERPGPPAPADDLEWLQRWWPGDGRAEVGRHRDEAWAEVVRRLDRGLAVAIDYGVDPATAPEGTLTGYRAGRQVPPVPDGSCDITAHVHVASCAAAGERAGASATVVTDQRTALRALGVDGRRPDLALATDDPARYAAALGLAGQAAELTDPGGLGGFAWIVHAVDIDVPRALLAGDRPDLWDV